MSCLEVCERGQVNTKFYRIIKLLGKVMDYWSKEAYEKRIEWIAENIKMCQRAKSTSVFSDYNITQADIIASLRLEREIHKIAYKLHRFKGNPLSLCIEKLSKMKQKSKGKK